MANQELESAADQDAKPRSPQIYINGELFDKENAKVSVFDHGLDFLPITDNTFVFS